MPLMMTGSTDVFRISSLVLNVSVTVWSGGVAAVKLTGGSVWILKRRATIVCTYRESIQFYMIE